jgi:hypothetical protein
MKSIQEIMKDAADCELGDVLRELHRENQLRIGTESKPGGVYTRWAKAEPAAISKHRNYEKQCALLYAAALVLATMGEDEFKRRLFVVTSSQQKLF